MKGGGRQRRAGVSGRGLEFHLNDCPSAHAAPRSLPVRAPQPAPAPAPARPAGERPLHGPGTVGSPCRPRPDLETLSAAAPASRAPRTSAPSQAREARRRRAGREPPSPRPSLKEVCGSRASSAVGRTRCQPRGRAEAARRRCPSRADEEAASYMEFGSLRSAPGLVPRPRPWFSPPPPARRSGGGGGGGATRGARGVRTEAPSSGGRARGRRW